MHIHQAVPATIWGSKGVFSRNISNLELKTMEKPMLPRLLENSFLDFRAQVLENS